MQSLSVILSEFPDEPSSPKNYYDGAIQQWNLVNLAWFVYSHIGTWQTDEIAMANALRH